MALTDIRRHMTSIRKQASNKYPEVRFEDICLIVEYVQTLVTPDAEIQAVPIEGSQWSQYLSPVVVKIHYERLRRGDDSYLILIQSGIQYLPLTFHHTENLENEEIPNNRLLSESLRTVAFNPDGTRLQNSENVIDGILNEVNSFRISKDCWTCHLLNAGHIALRDVFETIDILCKHTGIPSM